MIPQRSHPLVDPLKSTNDHLPVPARALLRGGSAVLPHIVGKWAARRWVTIPGRPTPRQAMPPDGNPFMARFEGHIVRGTWWGDGPVVYLVHGWAGDATQWAPLITALSSDGYRLVAFDAPSHGQSDPGPTGRGRSNAVEFGKALDAVAAVHGPAHAVVAHSLGALAAMLTLRYGWLSTRLLVFVAPMSELRPLLDQFAARLLLGRRAHRHLIATLERWVDLPVPIFNLAELAPYAEGAPLLVLHDQGDRRASAADSAELVAAWPGTARFLSTEGHGHTRLLSAPLVHDHIRAFLDSLPGVSESRSGAPT